MSEELNYTIAEDYKLPSEGKIYDKIFDPHIRLRSMTVREEMKRMSQTTMPHRVLCEIIDSCLLTKLPVSTYDMAIGDYEYLLHKLRVVTYGTDYKMIVGCPHCSNVHEAVVNLDDLKVKQFDTSKFEECKTFTLPKSQKVITIKYETPRILDSIDLKVKEFKKKNKDLDFDPTELIRLQELIDTVDGEKIGYLQLEDFVFNLSAKDGNFILNKIDKLTGLIGLDTSIDVTCKACGGDIKTFFRFGPEFFRPSNDQ